MSQLDDIIVVVSFYDSVALSGNMLTSRRVYNVLYEGYPTSLPTVFYVAMENQPPFKLVEKSPLGSPLRVLFCLN